MAWKPEQDVDPAGVGGGDWINFQPGQGQQLVILSDQPAKHSLHWVEGKGQPCLGKECRACELGLRLSYRFTVAVLTGGETARWEMALLTWKDLAVLAERRGQLRGLVVDVIRSGSGRDTRYTLDVQGVVPPDSLQADPGIGPPVYETEEEAGQYVPPPPGKPDEGPGLAHYTSPAPGLTDARAVARDPAGAMAYIGELCASLEVAPKAELEAWAIENASSVMNLDRVNQTAAFIAHLEEAVNRAAVEARRAAATTALDELFGPA